MSKSKQDRIKIEKKEEMRTKEISRMISEGGLGADNYYEIKKNHYPKKVEDEESEV